VVGPLVVTKFSAWHPFRREILSRRTRVTRPNVLSRKTLLDLEIHPIFIEAFESENVNTIAILDF
jgi:hypothetical protein